MTRTISTIDHSLRESANKAKSSIPISYGDVSGLLYRYANINDKREGSLKNYLDERPVRIIVEKNKSQLIKENLDNFVTISGEIRRHPKDDSIISITLETIEKWPSGVINLEEISSLYAGKDFQNHTNLSSDQLVNKVREIYR